ncbi:MAG: response regulator [Candidatus Zixiibacteriota bacterium]|nr:MAG: response regulator [candidate division Zixibacteria bacterium]
MEQLNGKPAVILLAEDDPGDQELTRRALEQSRIRNELYIVEDGEEALNYLLRRGKYEDPASSPKPDLMLLDLNMPKMDGKQLLEQMRADPNLRRIPVVALTTSKQENDIIHTYDLGANSYIVKPVDMDQFVSAIKVLKDYWFQIVVLPPRGE